MPASIPVRPPHTWAGTHQSLCACTNPHAHPSPYRHTNLHTYADTYPQPKPQTTTFPASLGLRGCPALSLKPPGPPKPPITVHPRDKVRPTLLCSTTTLCAAALSHVSMALQMLQIFSSAGVCRSGHPKSSTWQGGTARDHIHAGLCPLHSPQPGGTYPGGARPPCPDVPLLPSSPTLHPTAQTPDPLESQISAPLWVPWLSCPAFPHVHRDGDDALGSSPRGLNSQVWAEDRVGAIKLRPHKLIGKSQCFPSSAPPPAGWNRKGGCSSPKQFAAGSWSSRQPCPEPLCSPQLRPTLG